MPNTIDFAPQIAQELNLAVHHVANVIRLFDEGATIPFIARYRKEMTGTMNEENVAAVQKRLEQLVELQKRKESVIASIREQEKLTPELEQKILNANTLQEVEDLYLPYKPKRRTRAAIAREKGLEPLAAQIMAQNVDMVDRLAARYVNAGKGVNDIEEALQGAKDIMAEWVSENINGRNRIRKIFHMQGDISSAVHVENLADAVAPVDVLRDPFCHDVLGALQGFFDVVDTLARIDIARGEAVYHVYILRHDLCGKRLQTLFAGDGGTGAAFGLVREVEVFHLLHSFGVQYFLFQFRCKFLLFADGCDDAFLTFL